MQILIAEDDPVSCRVLEATLLKAGHEVVVARNGAAAWAVLERPSAPRLAILDWMMPEVDGLEVCRRARSVSPRLPIYIIMVTARDRKEDVVAGLQAGADDYLTKPFDPQELRARVQVGIRIVELQASLADRVHELEEALSRVRQLQGLIPICSYCKKIRDDSNYWQEVETYVSTHSDTQFSHGICPDCYDKFVKPQIEGQLAPAGQAPPAAPKRGRR